MSLVGLEVSILRSQLTMNKNDLSVLSHLNSVSLSLKPQEQAQGRERDIDVLCFQCSLTMSHGRSAFYLCTSFSMNSCKDSD